VTRCSDVGRLYGALCGEIFGLESGSIQIILNRREAVDLGLFSQFRPTRTV
jgi:hypothetical protein